MNLTIITTAYNAGKVIEKTITSVLNQTVPVYEYIIVDAASKDDTVEIAKKYINEFAKRGIKYIVSSEKDRGISDGFNKGIEKASGDVIGIINADDELVPNTNSILQENIRKNNTSDIYYGNCVWVDQNRNRQYVSKPKAVNKSMLYHMSLIHPATFVKKDVYTKYGLFRIDLKYTMDQELIYRFFDKGASFYYIDRELAIFKAGGVSDTHAKKVYQESRDIAESYGVKSYKAKAITDYLYLRNSIVQKMKNIPIYPALKKLRDRFR